MRETNLFKMSEICRLCANMKSFDSLVDIKDPSLCLEVKLARCCHLEIAANDFLPTTVCESCVKSLNASWIFSEQVLEAQIKLKEVVLAANDKQLISNKKENFSGTRSKSKRKRKSPNKLKYEDSSKEYKRKFAKRNLSLQSKSDIANLHLQGVPRDGISAKLNLSKNVVTRWISRFVSSKNELNDTKKRLENVNFTDKKGLLTLEDHKTNSESVSNFPRQEILDDAFSSHVHNEDINYVLEKTENEILEHKILEQEDNKEIMCRSEFSENSQNFDEALYDNNHLIENCSDNEKILSEENEIDERIFNFSDSEKNSDGTINQHALQKSDIQTWNDYPWDCCDCGIRFTNVTKLESHCSKVHEGHLKFLCVDCSRIFTKYLTFINHVKRFHRPHLHYCCDICSFLFWNLTSLKEHRANHLNSDKMYTCQHCKKRFRSSTTLHAHRRSHLPINEKKKFVCEICFKKFSTKPNLMAHKRIHTGIREYTCEQCGKSFVQKGNLDNHILTHVPARPFSCDICEKSFKTQIRLNNHKSVHSGLKPHQCDVCGRQFREKGTLREHNRIHTGAMPFSCEFCGKRFRFKGVLTTHRRQHTGERPYSCLDCDHHFTNWPNYNKHMKRRHGINTSVTVRKPQTIPPSGIPAQAKRNYVVPTAFNSTIVLPITMPSSSSPTSKSNILPEEANIIVTTINDDSNNDEINKLSSMQSNNKSQLIEKQLQLQQHINPEQSKSFTTNIVSCEQAFLPMATSEPIIPDILSPTFVTNVCQGPQVTLVAHPPSHAIQQVFKHLPTQNHTQITGQFNTVVNYIPTGTTTMLGFYNLQNVENNQTAQQHSTGEH